MKKNIIYWVICIVFFVLYFKLLDFIWNKLGLFRTIADATAPFIIIFVNIPLSIISTEKVFKIIKNE